MRTTVRTRSSKVATLLTLVVTAVALSACSVSGGPRGGGQGGAYPDGPVEVIVTYAAGGASDQLARTVANGMEGDLGQPIIVQNEPGGSGTVGMTSVVRARPDGYRLGFIAGGPLTVQPHYGRTTYDHNDVTPIARVATAPLLLVVRADSPWRTLEQFVAAAEADPGHVTYASSGAGNPANIAMEKLESAARIETKQVPFESTGEVASALLGGNVDAAAGLPSGFEASVKSGEMRVLANLGDVRASYYEDTPTLADSGYAAVTNVTNGLVGPAGLSPKVVRALTASVKEALARPEIDKRVVAAGFVPEFADGATYGASLDAEYEETGKILDELGMTGR